MASKREKQRSRARMSLAGGVFVGLLLLATSALSLQSTPVPTLSQSAGPDLGGVARVVDTCTGDATPEAGKPFIWIVKQWHLSPGVSTANVSEARRFPQFENQRNIYTLLDQWVRDGKVSRVVAEGCEGEVDRKSNLNFYGWSYADLFKAAQFPGYEDVLAHIPMKLKAKYRDKIAVTCGDDLSSIQAQQLSLSDLRAYVGYKMRIEEFAQSEARQKPYLEGAREIVELGPKASAAAVLYRLGEKIKVAFKLFKEQLEVRNQKFSDSILKGEGNRQVVLVVGGLHAKGILKRLKENKQRCAVLEPIGYGESDVEFLDKMMKLVKLPAGGEL